MSELSIHGVKRCTPAVVLLPSTVRHRYDGHGPLQAPDKRWPGFKQVRTEHARRAICRRDNGFGHFRLLCEPSSRPFLEQHWHGRVVKGNKFRCKLGSSLCMQVQGQVVVDWVSIQKVPGSTPHVREPLTSSRVPWVPISGQSPGKRNGVQSTALVDNCGAGLDLRRYFCVFVPVSRP